MDEQISIKLNIGDRHYPIKIQAADEEKFRKAAKLINEVEKQYRDQFALKDKQDALAMTALEFATKISESSGQQTADTEISNKLMHLQSLLKDYSL